ncbi:MAG: type II toxin-antitoxin system RelE/ParE family toxin [Bryobacteraceae bacterium]
MKRFELSRRALRDLEGILDFIAERSLDAADRVQDDFDRAFRRLAQDPGMGHLRQDLTKREVLFWRVHSYLVIYEGSTPLRIVRILHGKRDVSKVFPKG